MANCFQNFLRVDRPFGVFWPRGGADSCRRGERPPGTGPAGVGDGGFDPADHRGERGGSVPFLRAENVGRKPVLILDGEELVGRKQNRIVSASIIILEGEAIDIPVSCMEAGRWNFNRRDFRRARRCSGQVAGGAEGERRGKPGCGRKLPQRQGAVWREVSYSLREAQAPSPTSDYREGRAKVSRQIDSFVERVQPVDGQVGAIFLCARGILGLELLGEEDLFKGACPRSSGASPSRCSTTRISAACRTWRPRGGRACRRPPVPRRPSPGAGYDLRIDTGEVIGSGLYWNHSLAHLSCFPGAGPGTPSERPGPRRTGGPAQPQPEALGAGGRQQDAPA